MLIRKIFLSGVVWCFLLGAFLGCGDSKQPVKIGFANTLTGKASTWGLNSRNGAMLAVDEWNQAGGVNGRPIELIFKDDKANPDEAWRVDQELIDLGVDAIIGHYISTICLNIVPLLNKNHIVMVSTAASTTDLAGKDDWFFRLVVSNRLMGGSLGSVCFQELGLRRVAVAYDSANPGYSESFYTIFKKVFEQKGGAVITTVAFNRRQGFSSPDVVKKILATKPDGVCLISDAIHGALICQHLRKTNPSIPIVASGWTFSDPNFISTGGNAVEGVVSINEYDGDSRNPAFQAYKKKFREQFGEESTHPDKVGYEAAQIILTALSHNENPKQLKETILKIKTFPGADGPVAIDQYGDSVCPLFLRKIQKGKIRTTKQISLADLQL